jgi:predicted nucleic acid-binding protein
MIVAVRDKAFLLDTSALLTFIEDEEGAARVEQILREGSVFITWMSLLEVYYITQQERGQTEAERRHALLKSVPVTFLWQIDEPMLLTATRLKASYRLSLADTIIAAYAIRQQAILLHKDPEFAVLSGLLELEALPYKNR